MNKLAMTALAAAILAVGLGASAVSQGPDDRKDRPPRKGPPPKGFELGKLLPPHILEELELTEEQQRQLRELEKETRKKLQKILTEKQQKQIEKLGRRRPGPRAGEDRPPPPRRDRGKGKGKRPPADDDDDRPRDRRPPPREEVRRQSEAGGIAWFASWAEARSEAKRTNRPILLVSAAPHCAGVSGVW